MQKKIITILIVFIFSCSYLPESIGIYNEIIILISNEDRALIKPFIDGLFENKIQTPQSEKKFKIKYDYPWNLKTYKKNKYLILAGLDFPSDSTGDLIISKFVEKNKINDDVVILNDLYAKNQLIMILKGLDAIDFEKKIKLHYDWILNELNKFKFQILSQETYRNGENSDLSDSLKGKFNYSIKLQPDYKKIRIDTLNDFIWIGRGYPYRWITILKTDKHIFETPSGSWIEFENIINNIMPEIKISNHFRDNELIKIGNKNIKVLRGLYEHFESGSGGPFVTYMFEKNAHNELILATGFVNNPGKEKIKLIEELEVIIRTLNIEENHEW